MNHFAVPLFAALTLTLALAAPAQVSVSATAVTPLLLSAVAAGISDDQVIPAGTNLAFARQQASRVLAWPDRIEIAAVGLTTTVSSGGLDIVHAMHIDGQNSVAVGLHDIRVDFTSPVAQSGVIRVTSTSNSWLAGLMLIDVGADGSLDAQHSLATPLQTESIAVALAPSQPLSVLLRVQLAAGGFGSLPLQGSDRTRVEFLPGVVAGTRSYGGGCSPFVLDAVPTTTGVDFSAAVPDPLGVGLLVIGLPSPPVPLPFAPPCSAHVVVLDSLLQPGLGSLFGALDLTVPGLPPVYELGLQAVALSRTGEIRTSNGILVQVPPR